MAPGDASAPVPAAMRRVLGHFASGVAVVTGAGPDGPVGFTCQSLISLSLEPPLVALAPSRESATWPHLFRSEVFCANVLRAGQEHLARGFSRRGADKFLGVAWSSGPLGAPRIDGALAWIDCRVHAVHPGGDHHLVVARVLSVASGDGEQDGEAGDPLVFYRGGFATLGSRRP